MLKKKNYIHTITKICVFFSLTFNHKSRYFSPGVKTTPPDNRFPPIELNSFDVRISLLRIKPIRICPDAYAVVPYSACVDSKSNSKYPKKWKQIIYCPTHITTNQFSNN